MTIEQLARQGRRTATLTTAATITSKMNQIRKESIKQAFSDFENVKYRYELVNVIEGVSYYDDSAARSAEATWFSFDNINEQMVWITYADNIDCDELVPQVKKYVKTAICIGDKKERFDSVYGNILKDNVVYCKNIHDAVAMAYRMTTNGDNVMFSPACSVKDEFVSYEERGDYFKQCVKSLI